MMRRMRLSGQAALTACLAAMPVLAQPRSTVIDGFERRGDWTAVPSDGASMRLTEVPGRRGKALRVEYDLSGGGYVILRRAVNLALPPNYQFTFAARGEGRRNNLEFKLVDSTGENVWWSNQRDFAFPRGWTTVTRKKRQISFAWGPKGGGVLARVAAIELAISAGRGGKGTVWLDDLILQELPVASNAPLTIAANATSSATGHPASAAIDGDSLTSWRPPGAAGTLDLDFGESREFGGLTVRWARDRSPSFITVRASDDGRGWRTLAHIAHPWGTSTMLRLPESESRFVRLDAKSEGGSPSITDVVIHDVSWAATPNDFAGEIARAAPRGAYPRALRGEQSYWTAVGADRDSVEGLLSADGAFEPFSGGFSIEPFVRQADRVFSWNDVRHTTSLDRGLLPFPLADWRTDDWTLTIAPFTTAAESTATTYASYTLRNVSTHPLRLTLALAVRPIQVNPPWQFLQTPGGVSPIRRIERLGDRMVVNGDRHLSLLTSPSQMAVGTYEQGDAVLRLYAGAERVATQVMDTSSARASAVLSYSMNVAPGDSQAVVIAMRPSGAPFAKRPGDVAVARRQAIDWWSDRLRAPVLSVPESARPLVETLHASFAAMLLMRDGPALRPGARSYARSWIRDGAMMSAALLRAGMNNVVREYVEWYARYQYPNGKVPCCVDDRGADPVPEHDSHGEFIYLVAEYLRFTRDTAFAVTLWPHVSAAVSYINQLRAERLTAEYRTGDRAAYFGILPPSISHEGYSSKPMHSYWDDFWALRGLKDAAWLAVTLGRPEASAFARYREDFRHDVVQSIERSMRHHRIPYIPGAADLGDFDATSTTIAIAPVDELASLPAEAVDSTFERYFRFFARRRGGGESWEAYTPYELRLVGTFVRLGQRERALELADFFLGDQRPEGWRQWAEVVWRDPSVPRFIGDLPHAWVASDFARSFLDFFAFERERDSSLVLAAGIPSSWVGHGDSVAVSGLRTQYGPIAWTLSRDDSTAVMSVRSSEVPPGGFVISLPWPVDASKLAASGQPLELAGVNDVRLRRASFDVSVPLRTLPEGR